MTGLPEIELKLKWRKTWDDRENDFIAVSPALPDGEVGRIHIVNQGPQSGGWYWAFQASTAKVSRNLGATTGVEPTPREAAKRVEDYWFLAIKDSEYEIQTPQQETINGYAAAKGR